MQITFLKREPIENPALGQDGQAELFNYLLTQSSVTMRQMVEAMRCKSPAPIISRLKHLEERGLILVSQ